jgi:hypothetical protein
MMKRKMKEGKKRVTIGLALVIASVLIVACAPLAFALPTADNVGIADYTGEQGSYVIVPVTITNVQDGPIISMVFDVCYDKSVLEVVNVQNGDLTASWNEPAFNDAFAWGTRFSLVYQGETAQGLQNGATGSIVLFNFSVSGEPGATSWMNLTNIQFSDTAYKLGTAPANNGSFTISTESDTSTLSDTVEDIAESEAYWAEDGLWHITTRRSESPSHSWWYGQEATGTYSTGGANSGSLVSKVIDLTGATDATLNFWTYWQTESSSSTKWDKKLVEISTDGGATWSLLQQLSGSMQGDITMSLQNYCDNVVMVRFRFDTVDKYYNNYEGWFIDDISITADKQFSDLTVASISEKITEAGFTMTYTVTNIGNGVAGASNTAISIDGTNVFEDPVPALSAGASYTNTVGPFDCPCGATLTVMVCADTDNTIAESSEANNCRISTMDGPKAEVLYVDESSWRREGEAFVPSSTPIQAAIDNAHDSCGITIYVAAGTYDEQITIEDKSLTLIGAGDDADPASNTIIKPTALTKSPIQATPDSDYYWDYIIAAYTTDYLGTQEKVKITGFRLDANNLNKNTGTHFAGLFARDISEETIGDAGLAGCTVTNFGAGKENYCMYLEHCSLTITAEAFYE